MDECIEVKWGYVESLKLDNNWQGRHYFYGTGSVMPAHPHVRQFLFIHPLHITEQVKLIIAFGTRDIYYIEQKI